MEEAFAQAYRDNIWNYGHIDALSDIANETLSGPGSTLRYTEPLRALLPAVLANLGVRSLLDGPCGDFNWMKTVPLAGIDYHGVDISSEVITDLKRQYPGISFTRLDLTEDPLPQVDFWLCRDLMVHLSDAKIERLLANWWRSGIRYFAGTHYFRRGDVPGYFDVSERVEEGDTPHTVRFVNLLAPPFDLPPPDYMLKDYIDGFPRRWLAVWDRHTAHGYSPAY